MDRLQLETVKRILAAMSFFFLILIGNAMSDSVELLPKSVGILLFLLGLLGYLYALFSHSFARRLGQRALDERRRSSRGKAERDVGALL